MASALVSILLAAAIPGYPYDELCYALWQHDIAAHGLQAAYLVSQGQWCPINYPPVYPALLASFAHVLGHAPAAGTLTSKALPILLWVAACVAVAVGIRHRNVSPRVFALFALNPVFLMDGPIWGQTDVLYTALSAGALLACDARPALAGALLALALLAKPLAIAAAPALAVTLCLARPAHCFRRLAAFAAGAAAVCIPVLLPFAVDQHLIVILHASFGMTVGSYNSLSSVTAANIWSWTIFAPFTHTFRYDTYHIAGGLTVRSIGLILLTVAVLGVLVWQVRTLRKQPAAAWATTLAAGAACYFAMFFLATEMQERYGYPAVFLLALLYLVRTEGPSKLLLTSATAFFNMLSVLLEVGAVVAMPLAFVNGFVAWRWGRAMLGRTLDGPEMRPTGLT